MIKEEMAIDTIVIGHFAERKMLMENLTQESIKENVRKLICRIDYFEDEDFEVCDEKYLYIINIKEEIVTLICFFTEDEIH